MGITNVGISLPSKSREYGLKIYPGTSAPNINIEWHTMSGTEWSAFFDISISFRRVERATNGSAGGWGGWSDWHYEQVPSSQCSPTESTDSDGWDWSHSIDIAGLKDAVAPLGWGYSNRQADALHFRIHMKSVNADGVVDEWGRTVSSREDTEVWVIWVPNYNLVSAALTRTGDVQVKYTSPGWERGDDRWAVEDFMQGGSSILSLTAERYSVLQKHGTVTIPSSMLSRLPRPIASHLYIRMVAAHRGVGQEFGYISGSVNLVDLSVCNTPVLTAQADSSSGNVAVTVDDAGDKGIPFSSWIVKMQESDMSVDVLSGASGVSGYFRHAPLGRPVTLEAIGYTDEGMARSQPVEVFIQPRGRTIIAPIDDGESVFAKINTEISRSSERDVDVIKLAGRHLPSAFYGVGGSGDIGLSFDIIDRDGTGAVRQREEDFLALGRAGLCVLRRPDGTRALIAIESVEVTSGTPSWVKSVSISAKEVG